MALRCRRVGAVHSIKRVGFVMSAICPVYPKQQTFPDAVGTSHLCQEQTSLLPPTALICQRQVNFGLRDNTASASAVSANYSGCFAPARPSAAPRSYVLGS